MITINGEAQTDEKDVSLADYLSRKSYSLANIAVEYNGEIIPKARYAQTVLHEGDVLEIVNFVGGG